MTIIKKLGLGTGCLMVLLVVLFVIWSNGSVTTHPNVTGVQGASTPKITSSAYTTEYFSTMIPDNMHFKTKNEHTTSPKYLQLLWASQASNPVSEQSDQLAIGIAILPSDGVKGVSDVQYRFRNAALYFPVTPAWAPPGSLVFLQSNPDSYEQAVFWPHDGHFASIVISGNRNKGKQLEESLKTVVEKWQWL